MNEEINFRYIKVLYPYVEFYNRINELEKDTNLKAKKINNSIQKIQRENSISLSKHNEQYFFNIRNTIIKFSRESNIQFN